MDDEAFVGGSGSAAITAGASNLFEFVKSVAASGGMDTVAGLTNASQVNIALTGYGPDEATNAVNGQTTKASVSPSAFPMAPRLPSRT
jgi:hypothetical protein